MKLSQQITNMILHAESKALGTMASGVINVVPVSTITIIDDEIILVDYFMRKTIANLKENPRVSLACWKGLEGYQIKALVRYKTEGDIFSQITDWITEILPERVVKGVLILTPEEIYDISAGIANPGERIL